MPLPAVGSRLSLKGYSATVRYVGNVDGAVGDWIGVEWDDPARGKHDGVKDGKRYFSCLAPNAGSFIRPLPSIDYGRPFLDVLVGKYIEVQHGSATQETVVLGSSNGAIQVEAVNLDKIRGKFSCLERLRDISLDKEGVSRPNPAGEIRAKCPSVRSLDLSHNLIASWEVIALIAIELPLLECLTLSNNRLQPFQSSLHAGQAFRNLMELQLNATLITWQTALDVIAFMPKLKHLELGYNRLSGLSSTQYPQGSFASLELLNLDGNDLMDWGDICRALRPFTSLSRLILSANSISVIPSITSSISKLSSLKHLALTDTRIDAWDSIDAISDWCPGLEGLSINGTPLVQDPETVQTWRQLAIARVPALRMLDGASISPRQRTDAELFYLSLISRIAYPSDAARLAAHKRWTVLCQLHGTPDISVSDSAKDDKLSNHLIEIEAMLSSAPPLLSASHSVPTVSQTTIRILPSAPLRLLRLKLQKVFKAPRGTRVDVWMHMADGKLSRLGNLDGEKGVDENKEIGWWLDEGAKVVVYLKPRE